MKPSKRVKGKMYLVISSQEDVSDEKQKNNCLIVGSLIIDLRLPVIP